MLSSPTLNYPKTSTTTNTTTTATTTNSSSSNMTLLGSQPSAANTSVCSKCHLRLAPTRPTFVTNIFHSPNTLFRQRKAVGGGGGSSVVASYCQCSSQPSSSSPPQINGVTAVMGSLTIATPPTPATTTTNPVVLQHQVQVIHDINDNHHDENNNDNDDDDDESLENFEVTIQPNPSTTTHPAGIIKPMAGSSTVQVPTIEDDDDHAATTATTTTTNSSTGITWQRPGRHQSPIRVRSLHYRQHKTKQPSPCDLYQCVAVDFVKASHRLCPMTSRVQLPPEWLLQHDATTSSTSMTKTWHAPDIFVVSLSIPAKAGKKKQSSGGGDEHSSRHHRQSRHRATAVPASEAAAASSPSTEPTTPTNVEVEGYTISMYFAMTPETRAILQQVTSPAYQQQPSNVPHPSHHNNNHNNHHNHQHHNPSSSSNNSSSVVINAVKLFDEWCRKSPTDPKFQGRFKLIPHIHNPKEVGLPPWMAAYNAKPLLIKRSGTTGILYAPPSSSTSSSSATLPCAPSILEFEVNFHPFPFLARQALQHLMEHSFDKLQLTLAFLIEGRTDEELPECLVGQTLFCHPHVKTGVMHATNYFGASRTDDE